METVMSSDDSDTEGSYSLCTIYHLMYDYILWTECTTASGSLSICSHISHTSKCAFITTVEWGMRIVMMLDTFYGCLWCKIFASKRIRKLSNHVSFDVVIDRVDDALLRAWFYYWPTRIVNFGVLTSAGFPIWELW